MDYESIVWRERVGEFAYVVKDGVNAVRVSACGGGFASWDENPRQGISVATSDTVELADERAVEYLRRKSAGRAVIVDSLSRLRKEMDAFLTRKEGERRTRKPEAIGDES